MLKISNETYLSTKEAAEFLGLAQDTIRRHIYSGLIESVKAGSVRLINKKECEKYAKNRRNPGRPKK